MLGAIIGDIVGSTREFNNYRTKDFNLFEKDSMFTDDTIMTIAICDFFLNEFRERDKITDKSIVDYMVEYGFNFPCPKGGYGGMFRKWLFQTHDRKPYNSYGNGSAMRVSSVGWLYDTMEKTLEKAKESAMPTHNHEEGIKGAQAIAACIFLARNGKSKEEIKEFVETKFHYDLNDTCDRLRETYRFDATCQGSCPQSIIAFLESTSFEDAIRNAVSIGGDSDTIGAMCGAIAEAYYGIPRLIKERALSCLPSRFKEVIEEFSKYAKERIINENDENEKKHVSNAWKTLYRLFDDMKKYMDNMLDENKGVIKRTSLLKILDYFNKGVRNIFSSNDLE